MVNLKEILYLLSVIPIFFLAIFILFMVLKLPSVIEKSSKHVSKDRPRTNSGWQAWLTMFYALDELKAQRKYRLIYYLGAIGVVGATIWVIYFTIYAYLLPILD